MNTQEIRVRVRAVIIDKGELLVVKHAPDADYYALPGGHLDFGEDPQTCLRRELLEELGVDTEPESLCCVYTFTRGSVHSVEFFFTVATPAAFRSAPRSLPSHHHEVSEQRWITPTTVVRLLPPEFHRLFQEGRAIASVPHFLVGESLT